MGNQGTILAYDRDARRAEALQANMQRLGASCVQVSHADFLEQDPTSTAFAEVITASALHHAHTWQSAQQVVLQVKGLLLDPSCSGSGTSQSPPGCSPAWWH